MNTADEMLTAGEAVLLQEITRLIERTFSPWCTRQQAASYTGYSARTIDDAADEGKITRYRANGPESDPRFKKSELDAWLEGKKNQKNHHESKHEKTPIADRSAG